MHTCTHAHTHTRTYARARVIVSAGLLLFIMVAFWWTERDEGARAGLRWLAQKANYHAGGLLVLAVMGAPAVLTSVPGGGGVCVCVCGVRGGGGGAVVSQHATNQTVPFQLTKPNI